MLDPCRTSTRMTAMSSIFGTIVYAATCHPRDRKRPAAVHHKNMIAERGWAQTQSRYLSLSTNSKQILVPNSGHYIQFDQPEIVLDAIRSEIRRP
jgi:pimeloyl-ACP methyl ester carboxylesterase